MMSFKKSLLFFSLLLCSAFTAKSQVNMQVFYDFGSDRKFTTLTLEMFKGDKWGNTYFFVDTDFNYDQHVEGPNLAPGGSYLEIARCLNFWQNTKLAPLSLQVEYNGGITRKYPINNAWLVGVDYFLHDQSFKNTFNFKVLYKNIRKSDSKVPMQLTGVWTCQDFLGLKGLTFDALPISGGKTTLATSRKMVLQRSSTPFSSANPSCGIMSEDISALTTSIWERKWS